MFFCKALREKLQVMVDKLNFETCRPLNMDQGMLAAIKVMFQIFSIEPMQAMSHSVAYF